MKRDKFEHPDDYKKRRKDQRELDDEYMEGRLIHCSNQLVQKKVEKKNFLGKVIRNVFGKAETTEVTMKKSVQGTLKIYDKRSDRQSIRNYRRQTLKMYKGLTSEQQERGQLITNYTHIKGNNMTFEAKFNALKALKLLK